MEEKIFRSTIIYRERVRHRGLIGHLHHTLRPPPPRVEGSFSVKENTGEGGIYEEERNCVFNGG
jgi:hypothetical protein